MQVPIQIVLKGVPDAPAVRSLVRETASSIERYFDRVTSCRVAITNPDARHRSGGQYEVHVSMVLPGRKEVSVSRRANGQLEREHLRVALRQAFAQARRQLQDAARKLRGDTKTTRAATRRARAVKAKED
jgi:hypothetical protein